MTSESLKSKMSQPLHNLAPDTYSVTIRKLFYSHSSSNIHCTFIWCVYKPSSKASSTRDGISTTCTIFHETTTNLFFFKKKSFYQITRSLLSPYKSISPTWDDTKCHCSQQNIFWLCFFVCSYVNNNLIFTNCSKFAHEFETHRNTHLNMTSADPVNWHPSVKYATIQTPVS